MTSRFFNADRALRPGVALLLVAYPLLMLGSAMTHSPWLPLAALLSLATALMLPRLLRWRLSAWLAWLGLSIALVLVAMAGLADLLLACIPIVINAMMACWFGVTLNAAQPRVAGFIIAIEGEARLAQPGVARYARQLTWFWTLLLGAQALLLALALLCAEHTGLLARLGFAPPLTIPDRFARAWLHVGAYGMIGAAMVLEYGFRRWHLRHLPHISLSRMLRQIARRGTRWGASEGAAAR